MTVWNQFWQVWTNFDNFEHILTSQNKFWQIWTNLYKFEQILARLNKLWQVWANFNNLIQIWQGWINVDKFEPSLTSLNQVWQVWTSFDKLGYNLTRPSLGVIQFDTTWPFFDIRDMVYDYLTSISDKGGKTTKKWF